MTFEEFQDNYDPCPTPEAYQNAKAAWAEATRQTAKEIISSNCEHRQAYLSLITSAPEEARTCST